MLTPVGNDVESSWQNIANGKSGIASISAFDTSAYSTRFAGQVKDLDTSKYLSPKDARKMDLFIQYGMIAGIQAIEDSGRKHPGGFRAA
jgi:3-oxoacyl-[acyl-carrier-protein] synthase II